MLTAKSALRHIAGIMAFSLIFLLARDYIAGDFFASNKEPFSMTLARDAENLNATLPEMVSENIRLDKAAAGPGNAFNYVYTVVDDDVAKNIAGNPDKLDELKAQLKERVCSVMPAYREHETIVKYLLNDNMGAVIADISINPRDC